MNCSTPGCARAAVVRNVVADDPDGQGFKLLAGIGVGSIRLAADPAVAAAATSVSAEI